MSKMNLPEIRHSIGAVVPGTGMRVGAGASAENRLGTEVERAAELLRETFNVSVEKRYNSDGRSGGAYVITDEADPGVGSNNSIGISIALTREGAMRFNAHVKVAYLRDATLVACYGNGGMFEPYAYPQVDSVEEALDWIKANSTLPKEARVAIDAQVKRVILELPRTLLVHLIDEAQGVGCQDEVDKDQLRLEVTRLHATGKIASSDIIDLARSGRII